MKKSTLIVFLANILLLSGCTKLNDYLGNPKCSNPEIPQLILKGNTVIGESVTVNILNKTNPNIFYLWSGPHNFTMMGDSMTMIYDNYDSGTYSVVAVNGNCPSLVAHISVSSKYFGCSTPDNTAHWQNQKDFKFVKVNNSFVGNYYRIMAYTNDNYFMEINFTQLPQPGSYQVKIGAIYPSTGNQVAVSIAYQNGIGVYKTINNGYITIQKHYNNLILSFCNLKFQSSYSNATFSGNAKIICKL